MNIVKLLDFLRAHLVKSSVFTLATNKKPCTVSDVTTPEASITTRASFILENGDQVLILRNRILECHFDLKQ